MASLFGNNAFILARLKLIKLTRTCTCTCQAYHPSWSNEIDLLAQHLLNELGETDSVATLLQARQQAVVEDEVGRVVARASVVAQRRRNVLVHVGDQHPTVFIYW